MRTEAVFAFSRAHAHAVTQGMGHDEALGHALAAEWAARTPHISRDSLLAGAPGSSSLVQLNTNGLTCEGAVPKSLLGTPAEAEARETIALWTPRTTAARFEAAKKATFSSEELTSLAEPSLGWGGGWGGHAILDYARVLREGLGALTARIEHHLARATPQTADWYRAILHTSRGITTFIQNHAARAQTLADQATDASDRQHYRAIADSCTRIACAGAQNFRDATQLFFFIHVLDGTDSPGRIDQFLLPYYLTLSSRPAERQQLARPILDALWQRFIACRSWNVCLAGQTPAGHDATNELTWLFLDLQAKYHREAPNLSVRFHKNSPERLMQRCVEVISLGSGLPALYNDEVIVPALVDLGIPLEHARDYALNGCMQIDIQGKSHMGLEDGELNLAKCLELALHAGKSPITGHQVGPATLPASQIHDLPTLRDQLHQQIAYCTNLLTRSANLFQQIIAESAPHLFRSLFLDDCIARGQDMKRGGPLYNHAQFLTEGLANTGDSLYTIQQLVFADSPSGVRGLVPAFPRGTCPEPVLSPEGEGQGGGFPNPESRISNPECILDSGFRIQDSSSRIPHLTLPDLIAILDTNWQGHEHLRRYIAERLPKYGNDADDPDRLTAETLDFYFRHLRTIGTWRGKESHGIYTGGLSTFNRSASYGRHLAATPDGRLSGEPVADSAGPARGRDRDGLTAMFRSVAALPQHLAASGFALNVRLSPSIFAGDNAAARLQRYTGLLSVYFSMGGQQMQINVVDSKTLREAKAHPDQHRDLIVRVGGFSARFVDLEPALQDDIIARTEHH